MPLPTPRQLAARLGHLLIQGRRLPVALGLLVTALVLWLHLDPPPAVGNLLRRLDQLVYDQRFALSLTPPRLEQRIVIVDYDERSLEVEGQWPWSRFKLGDLVRQLAGHGALVVGFDVFFPERERNLAQEARARLAGDDNAAAVLPELERLQPLLDGDRYFAQQMQSTAVALGVYFSREAREKGELPPAIAAVDPALLPALRLPRVRGYTGNVGPLQESAAGAGFFDTTLDPDGVLRRTPLVREYQGHLYPSLALEMARLYLFEDSFSLETAVDATGKRHVLTGLRMGQAFLPTDPQGQVLVPYLGRARSFPYLSATDVLRGTLSESQRALLENSLVLVGSSATGLYDLRATPVDEVFPGVEVHASVLHAILESLPRYEAAEEGGALALREGTRAFPLRPDDEKGALALLLAALGLLLSFAYPRLGPVLLGLAGLTFMLSLVLLNVWLWNAYRLDVSLVIGLLLLALLTLVNMGYGFLRENLTRRTLKDMFDQYVPRAHIDAMLAQPERYSFAGESRELTVLFADIRGFTSISERLSAAELRTLLNDYFTPITAIIFEQNGTIDKYMGDMVMAFWGAPLDDPQHHENALVSAQRMLAKVEELRADFRARGLPALDVGIGINSGLMNVGDMGSVYRRAYTVVGDAVNLGARLEGLTKFYGVKCLIGEETHDRLDGWLCRLVDRVRVQGKEQPVRIYEPLCRREEASTQLLELLQIWEQGCAAYGRRDWEAARAVFAELAERDPYKATLYEVYLQRIESLRESNLPRDWDGTFRHNAK